MILKYQKNRLVWIFLLKLLKREGRREGEKGQRVGEDRGVRSGASLLHSLVSSHVSSHTSLSLYVAMKEFFSAQTKALQKLIEKVAKLGKGHTKEKIRTQIHTTGSMSCSSMSWIKNCCDGNLVSAAW